MTLPNKGEAVTQALITDPAVREHRYGLDGSTRLVALADIDNIAIPTLTASQLQTVARYEQMIADGVDPTYDHRFPKLLLVVPDGATEASLATASGQYELLQAYRLGGVTTARCQLFFPTFTYRAWVRIVNRDRALRHQPPLDVPP